MQALTAVYGQLDISSNAVLSSLLGSFSSLNTVDAYIILSNNGLTSLDYAFPVRQNAFHCPHVMHGALLMRLRWDIPHLSCDHHVLWRRH